MANKKAEELRTKLPDTIRENVTALETVRKAGEKFYSENADLKPFKGAVATVFNEIATANPNWDYTKLLNESEVETRKRLNLPRTENSSERIKEDKKDVPSLPRKKSQQRSTPAAKSTDPIVSDIDAMNEVLYRRH